MVEVHLGYLILYCLSSTSLLSFVWMCCVLNRSLKQRAYLVASPEQHWKSRSFQAWRRETRTQTVFEALCIGASHPQHTQSLVGTSKIVVATMKHAHNTIENVIIGSAFLK